MNYIDHKYYPNPSYPNYKLLETENEYLSVIKALISPIILQNDKFKIYGCGYF